MGGVRADNRSGGGGAIGVATGGDRIEKIEENERMKKR